MRVLGLVVSGVLALLARPAAAQDPVKVDPAHYKVAFENDRVRVLHVTVGPGEKSPMHDHPAYVGVFLTDGKVRFALPDGKSATHEIKRGGVAFSEAERHGPENVGDSPFELIAIELKTPAAAAAKPKR